MGSMQYTGDRFQNFCCNPVQVQLLQEKFKMALGERASMVDIHTIDGFQARPRHAQHDRCVRGIQSAELQLCRHSPAATCSWRTLWSSNDI